MLFAAVLVVGCGGSSGGGSGAGVGTEGTPSDPRCAEWTDDEKLAFCSTPTQTPEYYAEMSALYFDTLDSDVPLGVRPPYAELVARWEWPPWLLLTGFRKNEMEFIDSFLKLIPTKIPIRDCRFFDVQPFGRCHVVFDYSGLACPIYEEFTFNDAGEMTFIEAWTDFPGFLPSADPDDDWAEGPDVARLANRIPGLGSSSGRIELNGPAMIAAADADADVAEFRRRAKDPGITWLIELIENGDGHFDRGCDPANFPSGVPQ